MAKIRHLLIVCLAGLALYTAFEPTPENIEIPWRLKILTQIFKMHCRLAPLESYFATFIPDGVRAWFVAVINDVHRSLGPNVTFTDTTFGGVPVRVFADKQDSKEAGKRPAIVFIHGGGWTLGSVDLFHPLTAEIASGLDAVVVSVEYRVAPQHVFPIAINDCTAATVGFLQHLEDFNVDPTRVAIMGDSAGGNLAAAVAQRLTFMPQYKDLPKLRMQVLIYPCLQAFDFQTPSYQQNGEHFTVILDRMRMAEFWAMYLGNRNPLKTPMSANQHTTAEAKGSPLIRKCLSHDLIPDEFKQTGYVTPSTDFGNEEIYDEIREVLLDPDYAPLMREDLRGLPEAYILTAGYDVLRDDGIMYAKRLEKAGVPVTWKHYKNGFHSMFNPTNGVFASPSADQALEDFIKFTKKRL
ncbi:arylacetamide deacetylase-like isoform X2 [Acanthaster planci]|nr:arylacetamide deacetylase-like isoform X2 [Acanthaster planci]